MTDKAAAEKQIALNYQAFLKMSFSPYDKGKFALLRNGELIEILSSKADAHKLGRRLHKDRVYSIQEITPIQHNLGAMSYALR